MTGLRCPVRHAPTAGTLPALLGLGGLLLAALLAGTLSPYPPRAMVAAPLTPPGPGHPLGTNDLGQDLWSQWLHGARASLLVGFAVAACSTIVSGGVGLLSVTWPAGRPTLLALTDALLALPHLPLVVLVLALLGPGLWHLVAALAVVAWPAFARVVRAQALSAAQRDYVAAARALGAGPWRILRTCLLPEVAPTLWTKFLLTVRWAILMEAALALMGLGDPNAPSWGTVLHGAFSYSLLFLGSTWLWWAMPPALGVAAVTLLLSVLGADFEGWLNPASRPARAVAGASAVRPAARATS